MIDIYWDYENIDDSIIEYVNKYLLYACKLLRNKNYELSISFVSLDEIHELNLKYRSIDKPTDVLSFAGINNSLGDIIISYEKAKEQAEIIGHSFERELAFLVVHGFLHLLGFDHETEEDEKEMIKLQKEIMCKKGE